LEPQLTDVAPTDLAFRKVEPDDDLSNLDFTQEDNTDEAGLVEFITREALDYQNERLGITYVFFYRLSPIAFVTLSMADIPVKEMTQDEKVDAAEQLREYSCLLVGRLGVDKTFRERHVGSYICDWVTEKARRLSEDVGCRYIVARAVKESVGFYSKCRFQCNMEHLGKPRVWMYKRLI